MLSTNSYPYFNDYSAAKDFHQILFRPGIPVQARELTQLQSILQNQVSRFGDHVFANGARVSGGQITANTQVYAVRLTASSVVYDLKAGLYLKGLTSGLVAEIVDVIASSISDNAYIVYSVITPGTDSSKFANAEQIYIYSDYKLETVYAVPVTSASGTTLYTTVTGKSGYSELNAADISKVSVSTFISELSSYVISVDVVAKTFKINNQLALDVTNQQMSFAADASTPTVLFGVTAGIFYINGYFVQVQQQQIVPSPRNRWCSLTVGLIETEEFIDADMDSTLLDPAQGSYNYSAPGADRLKISLTMTAYEQDKVTDPNFIELMRIEDGQVARQSKYTEYSQLMDTMARRTYDESGNYVVNPFIINLKDEGSADTITAIVNPGKAYVGGYEYETISPIKLKVDRALDTETAANFMVDTYVGNFAYFTALTGTIPAAGTTLTVMDGTTPSGTAVFMGIAPDAIGDKMYFMNIAGPIASGMTVSEGSFSATLSSDVHDSNYKLRVFPFPQASVKTVSNIDYKKTAIFTGTFTLGKLTIGGSSPNERFAGGTGLLAAPTAQANYSVFVNGGPVAFTVTNSGAGTGSLDSCVIQLTGANATYNGTGSAVATIDVNTDAPRLKTQVTKLLNVASVGTTAFTSLGYADLYKITYAAKIVNAGTNSGAWAAGSYAKYSIVHHDGVIYQANVAAVSADVPGVSSKWTAFTNIADSLIVNDGQRDAYYDHAGIKAKTSTLTNIVVLFDYFTHTGKGLLTVNSYPVAYDEIPTYTTNGVVIDLKDAIDTRARRSDLSPSLEFDAFQFPDSNGVELSVEYYLPRIDKIVLTNSKLMKVLRGISSYTQPVPPADLSDAMTLATIIIPPYTSDVKQIQMRITSNRRYTMRDIGVMDQRLGNVEYYTSMNALESRVLNSTQYSPTGTELFKSGFLADNFESFAVGNVIAPEYKCAIDTNSGVCRAQYKMGTIQLKVDDLASTTVTTGDLVTLPYTAKSFIKNVAPTSYMNINPFNVLRNIGTAEISPSSDYWFSTVALPQINVVDENTEAFTAAQSAALVANQNAQWGAWTTTWTGVQSSSSNRGSIAAVSDAVFTRTFNRTTTTTTTVTTRNQSSSKAVQSVSSASIVNSDNTKVVSRDVQPFIREKDVKFVVDGMTPYTTLHVWIDDVLSDAQVTPGMSRVKNTILSVEITNPGSGYTSATVTVVGDGTGAVLTPVLVDGKISRIDITNAGQNYSSDPVLIINGVGGTGAEAVASITQPSKGAELSSDELGHVEGVLHIPDGVFACGSHKIAFTDTIDSSFSDTCHAIAIYTAEGYINTTQRTIMSTRVPVLNTNMINRQQTTSDTAVSTSVNDVLIAVLTRSADPLAQTFFVESGKTPNGVFLESVDIYFATKDQSMPVILEIRPTNNGYPSSTTVLPFSTVTKYPSAIETSEGGTIATTFKFASPVYLVPGEYAIVLKTGSNKYQVFVSEMAKPIIGSDKVISEQPYIGSLFESQNASTWTADQFKDLCFEIRVCEFDKAAKTLVLKNSEFGLNADLIHALVENMQPASTSISTSISMPSHAGNIILDTDIALASQSSIAAAGEVTMSLVFTTNDFYISPVVDLERMALICVENIINSRADLTVAETNYQLGSALAKYVSGRVTLNQGFNASNIVVYADLNRPQESEIEIYFRAKNEFESIDLSLKPWILLTQEVNGGNTSQEDVFVEDKWSKYSYADSGFTEFNTYEIKVVMLSTNTSKVPVLANIRAIVLAG